MIYRQKGLPYIRGVTRGQGKRQESRIVSRINQVVGRVLKNGTSCS